MDGSFPCSVTLEGLSPKNLSHVFATRQAGILLTSVAVLSSGLTTDHVVAFLPDRAEFAFSPLQKYCEGTVGYSHNLRMGVIYTSRKTKAVENTYNSILAGPGHAALLPL